MIDADLMRVVMDLQARLAKLETRDTQGTLAGANPTGTAGKSAVNGSAATFMRSDGAPAIGDSDKVDGYDASTTPAAGTVPVSDGSGKIDGWVTANPTGANPTTAKVGTAAVNGSAATFLRSDGAPPIDQAMTPTWTGGHTFNADVTLSDTRNIVLNTSTGSKIGTATNQKLGFFNAAPIVQPSAYTQTYSTAAKTNPNATAATLTDNSGGSADTTLQSISASFVQAEVRNNFADLAAMVNKLTADHLATKKLLNSIIDDLQALGLTS